MRTRETRSPAAATLHQRRIRFSDLPPSSMPTTKNHLSLSSSSDSGFCADRSAGSSVAFDQLESDSYRGLLVRFLSFFPVIVLESFFVWGRVGFIIKFGSSAMCDGIDTWVESNHRLCIVFGNPCSEGTSSRTCSLNFLLCDL
jgi:hypothetical protein